MFLLEWKITLNLSTSKICVQSKHTVKTHLQRRVYQQKKYLKMYVGVQDQSWTEIQFFKSDLYLASKRQNTTTAKPWIITFINTFAQKWLSHDFINFYLCVSLCPRGAVEWVFCGGGVETLGEVHVQQKCIFSVAPCRVNVTGSLWSRSSFQGGTRVKQPDSSSSQSNAYRFRRSCCSVQIQYARLSFLHAHTHTLLQPNGCSQAQVRILRTVASHIALFYYYHSWILVQQNVSVCVLFPVTLLLFPEETMETELNTKLSEGIRATSPTVHIQISTNTPYYPSQKQLFGQQQPKWTQIMKLVLFF